MQAKQATLFGKAMISVVGFLSAHNISDIQDGSITVVYAALHNYEIIMLKCAQLSLASKNQQDGKTDVDRKGLTENQLSGNRNLKHF